MAAKTEINHEGKRYYSMSIAAKLLGTTTVKLRQLISDQNIDFCNVRNNGSLWVDADEIDRLYKQRNKHK
jgi:hypothetical protein